MLCGLVQVTFVGVACLLSIVLAINWAFRTKPIYLLNFSCYKPPARCGHFSSMSWRVLCFASVLAGAGMLLLPQGRQHQVPAPWQAGRTVSAREPGAWGSQGPPTGISRSNSTLHEGRVHSHCGLLAVCKPHRVSL